MDSNFKQQQLLHLKKTTEFKKLLHLKFIAAAAPAMDFHCLKRRRLQKLCKKLKIPANSSNLEMANKLAEFTKVNSSIWICFF